MNTYHIAFGKHRVEIYRPGAVRFDLLRRHIRVICQDLHAKCFRPHGNLPSDGAVACDSKLLSIQFEPDPIIRKRMILIQRTPDNILNIRHVVDIFHRLA